MRPSLDRFLTAPMTLVPGTTMPLSVSNPVDRSNIIAYLATLKAPVDAAPAISPPAAPTPPPPLTPGDWQNAAPGVKYHITVADLPPPYATHSSGNAPNVVKQPAGAAPSAPPGFTVRLFASGLSNPRIIRTAPNGDLFVAETGAKQYPGVARAGRGGGSVGKSDFRGGSR